MSNQVNPYLYFINKNNNKFINELCNKYPNNMDDITKGKSFNDSNGNKINLAIYMGDKWRELTEEEINKLRKECKNVPYESLKNIEVMRIVI